MFEFFNQIIGFFETIFSVVTSIINGLFLLVNTLIEVIKLPAILSAFVPSILFTSVLIVISFGSIKLLLGR